MTDEWCQQCCLVKRARALVHSGRVAEQLRRRQRRQVFGQQNDICPEVQVSEREGEDDQFH